MTKKILVTGGGGYIGRHVVTVLLELGFEVYVADIHFDAEDKHVHHVTTPIFSGDKDIFKQLGSPDVLIHLAWRDGFRHNETSHIDGIPMHYTFLRNMIEGGLKHVVGMGTVHEIGYHEGVVDEATPTNPQSLYGVAKNSLRQAVEQLAHDQEVVFQWIRAYYIYGDEERSQSVLRKLLDAEARGEKTFPFTSGKNKYDFIHVEELSRQIAAVANQTDIQGIINCCSGQPITLAEKVEQFIDEQGLSIRLEYGAFPDRPYDSPGVWGDQTKISQILERAQASAVLSKY